MKPRTMLLVSSFSSLQPALRDQGSAGRWEVRELETSGQATVVHSGGPKPNRTSNSSVPGDKSQSTLLDRRVRCIMRQFLPRRSLCRGYHRWL
jgi:hypothetical protein